MKNMAKETTEPADYESKYIDALDHLQTVRSIFLQGQSDCGRGMDGRSWSVLVTELEKLIALLRHYRPRDSKPEPAEDMTGG